MRPGSLGYIVGSPESQRIRGQGNTLVVVEHAPELIQAAVTSGVPLPESARVTDPKQLRIIDSNSKEVPSQMRVLSRWGPLTPIRLIPLSGSPRQRQSPKRSSWGRESVS